MNGIPGMKGLLGMNGLLGKELRVLAPFNLVLVGLQVMIWIGQQRVSVGLSSADQSMLRALVLTFAAALFGALFFGLEPPAVRSFLLQSPISRGRILAAKTGAAALHLVLYGAITEGLAELFNTASGVAPEEILLAVLLYSLCAWLSTYIREALAVLVGGYLIVMVGSMVLLPPRGSYHLGLAFGLAGLVATSIGLWYRLATLEDRPDSARRGLSFAFSRALRPRLSAVEWRQKWGLALLLMAVPIFSMISPWNGLHMATLVFLCAPLAGALLGATFFTAAERNGTGFFLHHLPIPRHTLVLQRLASNLALGSLFVLMSIRVVEWQLQPFIQNYGNQIEEIFPPVFLILTGTLFLTAFGLGAMLSPWFSSSLVSVVLTLLTLLGLVLVPGLFEEEFVLVRHLVLVIVIFSLAWWSTVHSRALEPGNGLRALWLLLPFWIPLGILMLVG